MEKFRGEVDGILCREWTTIMKRIIVKLKNAVKESGVLPSFNVRKKLAALYLKGEGLEIGALHLPTKIPQNVSVKYVDIATRDENIRRFPELGTSKIVNTDYLENGFEIRSIPEVSQDFVIANHVLEHADNPLKVLINWGRVIKPQGIMMITVPLAARSFDKGRPETTLEHFIDDYRLNEAGETIKFRERNREHIAEWLRIPAPRVAKMRGEVVLNSDRESMARRVEEMSEAENMDIHFHTFSISSFANLLECFAADIAGNFRVVEICCSRGDSEVVAILKKLC